MDDKIQAYRSPLVTATGIILGFILNFGAAFVKSDSPMSEMLAYICFVLLIIGIVALITVLYRILNINYPKDRAEHYYMKTLRYFIFGVTCAFTGAMIDMCANFLG